MIAFAKLLGAVATACALATGVANVAHAADPTPTATAPASVALASAGKSTFRLVVRSPKSPAVDFAAQELAKYVAQMSGATLEPGEGTKPGPRIVIGLRKDLAKGDRALLPAAAKGTDGYAIRVAADVRGFPRIVLGGDGPRGVVYGVYDLLERLGCLFVHPALDPNDPEIVPHAPDLTLAAGKWAVASPMKYRTLAWFEWRTVNPDDLATSVEQLQAQIDWAMKARYNVFESAAVELSPKHPLALALHTAKQRGMMLQAPGHNFDRFLPSDDQTFGEHPEWFGMKKGERVKHQPYGAQFCWTNHGAQKRFIDNVVAFVRERPDIDILELSGLDGGIFAPACACPVCAQHSPTDNVIALLNAVVARLAKVAPDVVVETLGGYQYSAKPPKDVKPDPRLRVFWAHWGRSPTMSYSSKDYGSRDKIELWARAFHDHLTVFQYYSDFFANSWFTAPLVQQIEGDRSYLIQLGVDGMLNLLYADGYWWRSTMNAFLAGRSFYDATLDPGALLREYALRYYGPAGELMAAYLDEWARDPILGARSRDLAQPEHRAKLVKQRRDFLDPAKALVAETPVYRYRLAKIDRLHTLAQTIMEFAIIQSETDAMIKRGDRDKARRNVERARARLTAAIALAKHLTDENTGLVDPEIGFSSFRLKQTWLDQQTKLLDQPPAAPPASATTSKQPRPAPAAGPAASVAPAAR